MTVLSPSAPAAVIAIMLSAASATAQTAIPPAPADYISNAMESDQYEVLAAQDALVQSHSGGIRAFAQVMIADHIRSSDALRQAATASGIKPPPFAITSDQAAFLSALQGLRGSDFDKAYASQQVLAHTQALAVTQSFASSGTDMNLRKAAQSNLPMIRRHLERAKQIAAARGAKD
jgi:putative membrane protein